MKLGLVVLAEGKMKGKQIPITLSQFLIGRDKRCHLRPASPIISNRHCAVLVKNGKVFVRDFESTNGTFVNGEQIKGEKELKNKDVLKVGPVAFEVIVETGVPVDTRTPLPPTKAAPVEQHDDEAAAMLLSVDENSPSPNTFGVDSEGIPTGTTIMDVTVTANVEAAPQEGEKKKEERKPGVQGTGDTSKAADSILQKYMRRPRTTQPPGK